MKILVEIPGDQFDLLLSNCADTDREYSILKNGLITPYADGDGSRTAVILCNEDEAKLVIALAHTLGEDAVQCIRQYPAGD